MPIRARFDNRAAMSTATDGITVSTRSRLAREAVELLSSMRFAISLLTLICIASVIGTVVRQNEPTVNVVNQFGPFWAEVFTALDITHVYSAPWFLVILAFLVLSTSLCILRNAPKILADLRSFKEHVREQSLQAFHHKGQATVAGDAASHLARVDSLLAAQGWKARAQVRPQGTMVAARKGSSNKLGYLAAHGSIVLICVGGLLDGDLIVRAQMALQDKTPYRGSGLVSDVPAQHRLGSGTAAFRANLFVPEGQRAGTALLNLPGGVVLQDLPFDVELKKFIVEYYATGMPKLFASEILIHDRETGQAIPATVKVNEPAKHRGVLLYQSSFDDGGSRVKLRGLPLAGGAPFEVEGTVGASTPLTTRDGGEQLTLEYGALRVINVENMGRAPQASATDVRAVDLGQSIERRLGNATKVVERKELRNIGPSITYKLRDTAGQAREFHNYMVPVELEGRMVFLVGLRDTPQEEFRYLRIPADDKGRIDGWVLLRQALADPALRAEAAQRYARASTPDGKAEMEQQLRLTAERTLGLFAGSVARGDGKTARAGLPGLVDFIEDTVPETERERISEVLLRVLNGGLFELNNLARSRSGQAALQPGPEAEAFMTGAVLSLSDSYLYPAPMIFELTDFTQVQASVFQVARAPGKTLVYLGAVLLILGVFMMLYVRERRLWIWLQADPDDATRTRITTALSTTRRTLDADAEFDAIRRQLLQEPA